MSLFSTRVSLASFGAALVLTCAGAASAQAIFTEAAAGGGLLFVNQNTGAITYCVNLSNGGPPITPASVCGKIGTATPSATNPSLVISDWATAVVQGNYTQFITNVYTGKVTQCEYSYTVNTHTFYGDCAVIGTAS